MNGRVITKQHIKDRLHLLMDAFDELGAEKYDEILKREQQQEEQEIEAEVAKSAKTGEITADTFGAKSSEPSLIWQAMFDLGAEVHQRGTSTVVVLSRAAMEYWRSTFSGDQLVTSSRSRNRSAGQILATPAAVLANKNFAATVFWTEQSEGEAFVELHFNSPETVSLPFVVKIDGKVCDDSDILIRRNPQTTHADVAIALEEGMKLAEEDAWADVKDGKVEIELATEK